MALRRLLPFLLLGVLCAASVVSANGLDPKAVPPIGSIAPAFGLHPFSKNKSDETTRTPVQLDNYCGLRPEETEGVLVAFVDSRHFDDLELADTWHRRFNRQGLEILAISVDSKPLEFASRLNRDRPRFPVLDDHHSIVASRYGISEAPFSLLLNKECRILGFSNKRLSDEAEQLVSSIEALLEGQIGRPSGSMD